MTIASASEPHSPWRLTSATYAYTFSGGAFTNTFQVGPGLPLIARLLLRGQAFRPRGHDIRRSTCPPDPTAGVRGGIQATIASVARGTRGSPRSGLRVSRPSPPARRG